MRFRSQTVFRLFPAITCFVSFFSCSRAAAQAPQTPLVLTSSQQNQLAELTKRVLAHADRAGCKKNSCTILVVNFAGPSGSTSFFGMQVADAVSAQLAANTGAIKVADRQRLQAFLEKERIPSKLLEEDNAARWLAMENAANAVLVGYLNDEQTGVYLRVQLLDAHELVKRKEDGKEGPIEDLTFVNLRGNLAPAELFGQFPISDMDYGFKAASSKGAVITPPLGQRMPAPEYTDAARLAKFKGNIVLEVTISVDGRPIDVRVVRGLPFGLNRSSLEAVRTWTFRPATSGGTPVQVRVPVEATFRLY